MERIKMSAMKTPANTGAQKDMNTEKDSTGALLSGQAQPDDANFWKDKYVRLFADLENTKKRLTRSSAQEVEAEKAALLRELLPIADGLDMALMHAPLAGDARSLLQGIDLVRGILDQFLVNNDVTVIDALGKPFDPRLHEAIGIMPHPKFPPNTVVKVEQKGYLIGEKLLRAVQVVTTPGNQS